MPAANDKFPWLSYYKHYKFFEDILHQHSHVESFTQEEQSIYNIVRQNDSLRIFICDCYVLGIAEAIEVIENVSKINAIIINSNWCQYSSDAKIYCRERKIGLFIIKEFMAALNCPEYWLYLTKDQKKQFQNNDS